jgi:hypothetical protein
MVLGRRVCLNALTPTQPLLEAEACLDLDMFVGMNPDITEVQVYVDDFTHDSFPVGIIDAFTAIAQAETLPQIVSVSYSEADADSPGPDTTVTMISTDPGLLLCRAFRSSTFHQSPVTNHLSPICPPLSRHPK